MATPVTLTAEVRTETGTGPARRLRRAGKVPAVIYGHGETPEHIAVDQLLTFKALQDHAHMVELQVNGKTQTALIQDAEFDTAGEHVTHVDFLRVSADEPVEVEIEIKLVGSAKGEKDGGSVDFVLHTLQVRCLPGNIPGVLELKIDAMEMGDVLHASDVPLPPEVELLTDPESAVVTVHHPAGEEEPAAAEGEAPAEPELIKPERGEDEGDEGGD